MQNITKSLVSAIAAFGAASLALTSCVDHDYDLTEDIDMTIQIGSEFLSLPTSSVEAITLDKILDLDNNSSIKAVENDGEYGLKSGDYVLVQTGESTKSSYNVPVVEIGKLEGSTESTKLPEFVNLGGTEPEIIEHATPLINAVKLSDDNVTLELKSIEQAKLDVQLKLRVGFVSDDFAGTAYIKKGFKAEFDPSWTVIVDPASADVIKSISANEIEFIRDAAITPTHPLILYVRLTDVDFSKLPADQGLYAPGKFRLVCDVHSEGDVSIKVGDLPVGSRANLNLEVSTEVSEAQILAVTGKVEPEITINPSSFKINDIPDFLKDDENNLDIENPMIYFTVTNDSPLSLEVNGQLTAIKEGKDLAVVGIGSKFGTDEIIIPGESTKTIVISREKVDGDFQNVQVANLNKLLETIPDEIEFSNVTCDARPIVSTYTLGATYHYSADYEAVIPFAFGDAMNLHYTHIDDGWNEDLDKYNFNEVRITAVAVNTIPLNMIPSAVALDKNGNDITNITATVEQTVKAGSVENPSRSELVIILKSEAENIGQLDGIRLIFDATAAQEYVGVNLNKNQALRFDAVSVKIIGGVLIDLN